VNVLVAYSYRGGFPSNPKVANIEVIIACGKTEARQCTQGDIAAACSIAKESTGTAGSVEVASRIKKE